jgi:uncharacterized protein with HEPN domain
MHKRDLAYVDHILKCIKKIRKYVRGVDKKDFSKNELLQDAIIRNFEVIGEASKKISPDFKKINFEIPWKEIAGMRDKLIHDYLGVDIEVIWKTIEHDLPILQKGLKNLV